MPAPRLVAVMGPTASGKTNLAEALAVKLDAQLVNADAFQVYRGMDIGTAKPAVKGAYKLLDLKAPNEGFGVGEWLPLAHQELLTAHNLGKSVVIVGGTGLYIRALFEEYSDLAGSPDPKLRELLVRREIEEGLESLCAELRQRAPDVAAKVDMLNPARVRRALERLEAGPSASPRNIPPFTKSKLAVHHDKQELSRKIEFRVKLMMQNGWLEEVERLRNAGFGPGDPGFRALGYSALWQHLAGTIALTDALDRVVRDTRRYAKRQRSWLRSEPNAMVVEGQGLEALVRSASSRLAM